MTTVAPALTRPGPAVLSRRALLSAAGLAVAGAATGGAVYLTRQDRPMVPLGQAGLALGTGGVVTELAADDLLVPGTRVLARAEGAERLAAQQLAWLASGRVPAPAAIPGSTMISDALLDLRVLGSGLAAPVAAWSPPWRYVWPRDCAFVAVAYARTGHNAEAEQILQHLQAIQSADGTFQARYLPDRDEPPDARGVQLDGTGWALWALIQAAATLPDDQRAAMLGRHRGLLDHSTTLLITLAGAPRLPVSADYWELPERRPTLATSALVSVGLSSAALAWRLLGDPGAADEVADRAADFRARVIAAFAPNFPRRLGGPRSSGDLGIAFLLPPFHPEPDPRLVRAWRSAQVRMARPGGGLAPGGSWAEDGVSWTPTTATAAMTAAALGDRPAAARWLGWLDAHRTAHGAIPEKVLADGSPAEVAPLAWSAAAVIIAAAQLDQR